MSTNYATTEPAANVIPLPSLLPPIKTYQTPEKLQTLPRDKTSAYAEPLTDQVILIVSMTHPIVQYIVYYKYMYCLM